MLLISANHCRLRFFAFKMPSDPNKHFKSVQAHLLLLTIFGQTLIMGFAWGFTGAIISCGVIVLPDKIVRLIAQYPTVLTLIVTSISTTLSLIISAFFTFAVKEALQHHMRLSTSITLFRLRIAIALSRPTWILRWRHFRISVLTLSVYAMIQFLNMSWSTLLLPTLIQWPVSLSGTELNLGSVAFVNQLSGDLPAVSENNASTPAFETINFLTLLSGVSAVDVEGGVQTNSIFNFNGVSYNQSTGGVLPAVSEYAGSSNIPSSTGLYYSGGKVPVNYTIDWGRDWPESGVQGILKNYTVMQQGFTANVTCQGIDRSKDSFAVTPTATPVQGNSNYTYLAWVAGVNCSGNTNTMTYFTLGDSSGQLDSATQGFVPTVVCPDPGSASFNPYKFEIFMAGLGKYAFLPTTVCEVVPSLTTVNVTYNGGIISVDRVGTSSDLSSSSNLPLSQYIASIIDYQAGSNQAQTKNTIGDFLAAYGTNATLYAELESYWRGISEFSATQLRSGYSAAGRYPSDEVPSNMSMSTQGTMYVTTYGWQSEHRTFILLIVVITMIWGTTVLAAIYSLIKQKYCNAEFFDFSDPVQLIIAASRGLDGALRDADSDRIEEQDNLMVRFVDIHEKESERVVRKLELISA